MQKTKYTSAAAAVREYIDNLDKGVIFSGYDLKNGACKYYPEGSKMYVDTFLREMRDSRSNCYELLDRKDSLYRKTTPSKAQERAALILKYKDAKQGELFEGV